MNALWWTRLSVELVLLSFHLSVTLVIGVHVKRRHPSFTTGFFVLYLLQSVNDWMNYIAVRTLRRLRLNDLSSGHVFSGVPSTQV